MEFVKQLALKGPIAEVNSLVMSKAPRFDPSPGSPLAKNATSSKANLTLRADFEAYRFGQPTLILIKGEEGVRL
jgi:hypothetical protein